MNRDPWFMVYGGPGHPVFRRGVSEIPGKHGHNKGIKWAKRAKKREEAEARNAKTPIERTRAYRRQMKGQESLE